MLVFDREQVSGLVRDELVQVHKAIKKDADLRWVPLELIVVEVCLGALRPHHVVQLAKHVNKEDGLVIEVLETMDLLLVEVIHFLRSDYAVVVEVYHFEPVVEGLH